MAYAESTTVPVEKSRAEIEKLLNKFDCTQFMVGSDTEQRQAMVQFKARNRIIRFVVKLPDPKDKKFTQDSRYTWKARSASGQATAYQQAERQRWRALFLVIKAKLESVESEISTFEEEFMAHIVLPNDLTVGAVVQPLIDRAYENGIMPRGLLGPAGTGDA